MGLLFISEVMPCSHGGRLPKYNATDSGMQGGHGFREGGKRDPGKVCSSPASGPWGGVGGAGGGGGGEDVPEGRRTEEPKWRNPLSSERGWIPSCRLSRSH